jgi:hypothetical protein
MMKMKTIILAGRGTIELLDQNCSGGSGIPHIQRPEQSDGQQLTHKMLIILFQVIVTGVA